MRAPKRPSPIVFPEPWRPKWSRGATLCVAAVLLCSALAVARGEPGNGVVFGTLAVAFIALLALVLHFSINYVSYTCRVITTYQLMVCSALAFSVATSNVLLVPGTAFYINIAESYGSYLLSLILPLIIPFMVAASRAGRAERLFRPVPDAVPDRRQVITLIVLCMLCFGRMLSPFLPPIPSYVSRILAVGLFCLPFFAGKAAAKSGALLCVWLAALALNGAYHILIGARGLALLPAFLFTLGFVATLPLKPRRIAFTSLAVFSIPGIYILGLLGMIRDEVGRDDVSLLSLEQYNRIVAHYSQTSAANAGIIKSEAFGAGAARLVPWTNVVVPLMTPSAIPERGLSGLWGEVKTYTKIFAFGENREAAEEVFNFPANAYGFLVNEYTSVEWGVLADGWSRGGWLGGAVGIVAISGFLVLGERALARRAWKPEVKYVYYSVILTCAIRTFTSPFLDVCRFAILYGLLFAPLLFLNRARVSAPVMRPKPSRVPGRGIA